MDLFYSETCHSTRRISSALRSAASAAKIRSPLRGLVDLCPCDDGTLAAALYTRSVDYGPPGPGHGPDYRFIDTNALYSGVHSIDLKSGNFSVNWTKLGSATGVWVQKVPIFCWSLFESLTASLEDLALELRQKE